MELENLKAYWKARTLPDGIKEDLAARLSALKDTMADLKPDLANPQAFMSDFTILQSEISVINEILSFDEEAKDNLSELDKEEKHEQVLN